MLKTVRLKNFKLHEDTSIEAAPITVFIGRSNSGKSSIFQALMALRQALNRHGSTSLAPAGRSDTNSGTPFMYPSSELVNIGEFRDVVRGGRGTLSISVSGELESPLTEPEIGRIQSSLEVRVQENSLVSHEGSLHGRLGEVQWAFLGATQKNEDVRLPISGSPPGTITFGTVQDFLLLHVKSVSSPPPEPAEIQRRLIELGGALAGAPADLLNSLHPVFALRGFEEWGYALPQERVNRLERLTLPDRAVALVTTIASDSRLKKEVSDRLSDLLNIRVDIEYVGANRVKIFATEEKNGDGQRLFVNEGTGANQLPFILVPVALAAKNEKILLSEPEAHLHPKGQCELIRMLLTVAKKENIQFFIETHSEHVLHVILNAIGKGEWEPSQVAIYSFENIDGTAKATPLEVDEQGGVKGGLPGFFDRSLDELTEYLETLKKPTV